MFWGGGGGGGNTLFSDLSGVLTILATTINILLAFLRLTKQTNSIFLYAKQVSQSVQIIVFIYLVKINVCTKN